MAKSYQLVALTEKGQVKMIPSLAAELAKPYVQKIHSAVTPKIARVFRSLVIR